LLIPVAMYMATLVPAAYGLIGGEGQDMARTASFDQPTYIPGNVILFGDSNFQTWYLDASKNTSCTVLPQGYDGRLHRVLQRDLKSDYGIEAVVENWAAGGMDSTQALTAHFPRFDPVTGLQVPSTVSPWADLLATRPSAVVINFGSTDAGRDAPAATTKANLETMVMQAKAAGVTPILATCLAYDYPAHYTWDINARLSPYSDAIIDVATTHSVALADNRAALQAEIASGNWDLFGHNDSSYLTSWENGSVPGTIGYYQQQHPWVGAVAVMSRTISAAVASAVPRVVAPVREPALVDAGFEGGTDGGALASPLWKVAGSPQHREYERARAKNGNVSGWIQGPTASTYAGVGETVSAGMSSNVAEQRFWLYFDTANQFRVLDDFASNTADRAFFVQFSNNGKINVYTNRAGNPGGYTTGGYTPVGTYTVGWTQFRIVYDFTTQTYTLSKRVSAADPWTELKRTSASSNAIPFRGTNTITQSHGLLFRAYQNVNLGLDDVAYSDSGIN